MQVVLHLPHTKKELSTQAWVQRTNVTTGKQQHVITYIQSNMPL